MFLFSPSDSSWRLFFRCTCGNRFCSRATSGKSPLKLWPHSLTQMQPHVCDPPLCLSRRLSRCTTTEPIALMNWPYGAVMSSTCCAKTATPGGSDAWTTDSRDTFCHLMLLIRVSGWCFNAVFWQCKIKPLHVTYFIVVGDFGEEVTQSHAALSEGTAERSTPTRVRRNHTVDLTLYFFGD